MATITFTYNGSMLSNTVNERLEAIRIFPNPTKSEIRILNTKRVVIETLKIYNILGSLVKHIAVKSKEPDLKIDLTPLQKGVYLTKLETTGGLIKTQKLIIR